MDEAPWLGDEHTFRKHEFGCPDFPPLDKVFTDEGRNYFIAILGTRGEINQARLLSTGQIPSGGMSLVTLVADVLTVIFGALWLWGNKYGHLVVSREPADGAENWTVVYREVVSVKGRDAELRACALLKDWETFKTEHLGSGQ
jgi:hypothetical protein